MLDDTDNKRKEYNAPRLTHHMNLRGKHTISTCGMYTMNQPAHRIDSLAALVHPIYAHPSFNYEVVTYMTISSSKMIVALMNGMRAIPPPGFNSSCTKDIACMRRTRIGFSHYLAVRGGVRPCFRSRS